MKSTHIVKELFVYPIKSLAGISIQSAKAQEMGFEYDRRWMLIDEENQFITQREHPDLSQFYPKIIDVLKSLFLLMFGMMSPEWLK